MFTITHCKDTKIELRYYPILKTKWMYCGTCPSCKTFILYIFKIDKFTTRFKQYCGEEARTVFNNHFNEGGIYFIKHGNFIKIGYSENIKKRLKSLQTACPEKLELLFSISGTMETEKRLQRKFKQYNCSGEWFNFDGKLKEFIDYCLKFKNSSNRAIIKY